MLHEKIRNTSAMLGELAGKLNDADYDVLRLARLNLQALAESVATLEANCTPLEAAGEEA